MHIVTIQFIREKIVESLAQNNRNLGLKKSKLPRIDDLDRIGRVIQHRRNEALNESLEHLYLQTDLANLAISVSFLFEQALATSDSLFKDTKQNRVLSHLFGQLINQGLAILELSQMGFDTQARIILRATLELSCLTMVLAADQKLLSEYADLEMEEKDAKKTWAKHFTLGRLTKKLAEIESRIPFDKRYHQAIRSENLNTYSMLSMFVHSSAMATLIGGYAVPFDKSETLISNTFGKVSDASGQTLATLYFTMHNLISLFPEILLNYRLVAFRPDDPAWCNALAFRRALIETTERVFQPHEDFEGFPAA